MAASRVKIFLLQTYLRCGMHIKSGMKNADNVKITSNFPTQIGTIHNATNYMGLSRLLALSAVSNFKRSRLAHRLNERLGLLGAVRTFSNGQSDVKSDKPASDDGSDRRGAEKKPLKLMEYNEMLWPNPIKMIKNYIFSFLIKGYFDEEFTFEGFLNGAEQAILNVSLSISRGQFEALEGLVSREAIREIREHYIQLSPEQQAFIAVNPKDIFFRFIYEIGMIFDKNTDARFVEITTVYQGLHGLDELRRNDPDGVDSTSIDNKSDQIYICNYRFIREFTKGKTDDWTINKLNHFCPKELVQSKSLFSR